jgi:cellulose biosynthesis protein BcsQ
MREDMKKNYDYVLIDTRPGLSDVTDICTIELPDILVVCFAFSDQSMEGAANVARQISRRYRDRNIRILPVPMRVDDGEKEKLDIGRALAQHLSILPPGRSHDYYGATSRAWSPYQPEFVKPISDVSVDLARKCLDARPDLDAGRSPSGLTSSCRQRSC